jgi:WD40 repeat protein
MSTTGGEPRKISLTTSADMIPVSLSPDGSQLLVIDGQGAPPKGPLWSFSILGGSPRRLGDIIGETASWSPEGNRITYSNLGDLFVAKADGTESRKLLSVSGDIKNIAWSPDGRSLRFDSSESAGSLGQQLAWEVSADGIGLHRLLADWHNRQTNAAASGQRTENISSSSRKVRFGRFRKKAVFFALHLSLSN